MTDSQTVAELFPRISDQERLRLLEPPSGPVRVVIDTDTHNEIDDQFTLAWALLSQDLLEIEGIYAAPYSFGIYQNDLVRAHELLQAGQPLTGELSRFRGWLSNLAEAGAHPADIEFVPPDVGMEKSFEEILTVYEKLGLDPGGRVFRGSERYLSSYDAPVESPAAEHLIQKALENDERPLYVAAIGALTNVASALLLEPAIAGRIVVLWTAGFPASVKQSNPSFNMEQDMLASKLLFDCGVPLVYLPGFHVGAQLRLSLPEMEEWVRGRGAMGDYLYWLYTHNPIYEQRFIRGHFGRSWVIWDLINIAWLLNPGWVPSDLVPSPILDDGKRWQPAPAGRHLMREAYEIDRDGIFRDFFRKLEQAS
jgi:inosine-uridine nucleoside N-ribohydrolase